MPFASTAQQRFAFGTKQPWAKRWADETDFSKIPKRVRRKMRQLKDAGTTAGAMAHGPGGLLATPGMGGARPRKWGNRRKLKDCTCGVNVATKEQIAPGVTRIRGNLCNVHGRYGPCDAGTSGKKPKGGKGRKPRAPAKPKLTPEQRAAARDTQHADNRTKVLGQLGIAPDGQHALEALRSGAQADAAAIERGGFVKVGLVEQAADGSYRLTPSGRAALSAANSGDAGRAGDIISGARDRTTARTARQDEAAARKRDAAAKRAAAQAAKKPAKGGGGSKQPTTSSSAVREAERQQTRQQRQSEHAADRAQRQREHTEDRVRRLQEQEHEQDRAQRPAERRQMIEERRANALDRSAPVPRSRGTPIVYGRNPRARAKAQSAEDRAMFAKMGGGKGGKGGGGHSTLWSRNPETGKREPSQGQLEKMHDHEASLSRDASETYSKIRKLRDEQAALRDHERWGQKLKPKYEKERKQKHDELDRQIQDHYAKYHQLNAEHDHAISQRRKYEGHMAARTKAGDPGDYLVVEDREKPSTWHLQVRRNGTPDHGLMGSAWAALHSGFRGNKYAGPNKDEAISKLRALYKREKMDVPGEKSFSFTVFKDDTDAWRWVARTTTAYRDRDEEIITTKALEADAQRMTATKQYGPLRYWHIGNPDPFDPTAPWGPGVDIGECDYSIVIGRTSIESGTFKSHAIGKAFAESADEYELSPGFFHPPSEPNAAGEFNTIRRFERSVVPIKYGRASNLFTGMTVKGERMDQQTYDQRVKAFLSDMNAKGVPAEVAAGALAGMQQADKSAEQQGIAFKTVEPQVAGDPWAALLAAFKGVVAQAQQPAAETTPEPEPEVADEKAAGDEAAENPADEGTPEDMAQDEGDYLGDMNVADFEAMLASALEQALAPLVKGMDIAGKMAGHMDELKAMYGGATAKSEGVLAEIASLKARLAELEGYQPAVVAGDVEAALKNSPQSPPDPDAPFIPSDPDRPMAGIAARLMPQLYSGYDGANGWQKSAMPPNKA